VRDRLKDLALDQRLASSHYADALWSQVDPQLWEETRNPWLIVRFASEARLKELELSHDFQKLLRQNEERASFGGDWFEGGLSCVAYFSMEFGLSEALPIYSGGLGILAGDHLKSASDLGVPVVGVGILYQQGYFRQAFDRDGRQLPLFPVNEPEQLPVEPCPELISLEFPGRKLWLRAWKVRVGRVPLYLLDTNCLLNSAADRGITAELYGGNVEMRMQQELVLGVGGWRLLQRLGYKPDICHLNEGHAAFATLERARSLDMPFEQARAVTRSSNLFTTHTPVEAGFDRFPESLVHQYLGHMAEGLGISIDALMDLGREKNELNMAHLAIQMCGRVNAVSQLHAEVSRRLFPSVDVEAVTNGVHVPSWESPEADRLWSEVCGEARWHGDLEKLEENFRAIPDEKLLLFRRQMREKLIHHIHSRLNQQRICCGLEEVEMFDPSKLTIGFARRFASYKRVTMLLEDPDRLERLLDRVQLFIAGKAHPADEEGQEMVRQWNAVCERPGVQGKVAFLSDYDIVLAGRMVQGVDLWINTPKRPWEACGTSGMKVLANGGLNLSVLDGWWAEAFAPDVGWALEGEADQLYDILENEVIPEFYDQPDRWLARVRESMARLAPQFSTNRMVRDYTQLYLEQAKVAHGTD
jgi:glycogen phosphorylase